MIRSLMAVPRRTHAVGKDDEAQEQAKVGAFEEPTTQQAQQEKGEGVDLFSISTTTDRK